MNKNNKNIPPNKKDEGTNYDRPKIDNNNLNNDTDINNNIINFENNNNNNINNLNQISSKFEINEEFENSDESESNKNISSSYNNNLINPLVPTENFSQQVDFLFHPKNPEWQTENIQNINNNYNNNTKIILPKQEKKLNFKNNKNNKKKSKSKNKFRGGININKFNNKKKLENRPEFDLSTKIEQKPKKYNLSFFYGTKGDSKYEKQIKLRQQKIEQYEEDFQRKKEIYKAKRQREDFELKKNYMNQKYKTSSNFYPKKSDKDEFSQQIENMTKINYPNTNIRNFECNPQKYDIIIHSLLSEISAIKLQREKENKNFEQKIKQLQNDNEIKKRPKSSIKNIKKNKDNMNNNLYKNIEKYFEKNNKKNKRPLTAKKYGNKKAKIEHEIPVPASKKNSKNSTQNNYYRNTKDKIIQKLKELEIQKQNKINEIFELQNNNNINYNYNNKLNKSEKEIEKNNSQNYINNQIQNISNSPNIILQGPQYLNFNPSINTQILNFQDKAQILTELNNNIAQFTSGIPKLMSKVNEALNKIYANTDDPIKKAINNHPFVIMAAKATHQTIKNNMDNIIEGIIDDLIGEITYELNDIEEKEKKNILMNNCGKTRMKLNEIKRDEIITLEKYSKI